MRDRKTICALLFALALLTGCQPKGPDPALILWSQPAPEVAARAHAREKGLVPLGIEGTSMEPFLVAGDWVVIDPAFPFKKLKVGDPITYAPDWQPGLVLHACAAKSGDAWIMDGINNPVYENRANGGLHVYARHYRGKMVQGYTRREKP